MTALFRPILLSCLFLSLCMGSAFAANESRKTPAVVEAALSSAVPPEKEKPLTPIGAGADIAGGYAGQVLQKFLPHWEPPKGSSGVLLVLLRLSNEGQLLFCETKKGTGNAALDESPCLAALKAKSFGAPPSGGVSEVWLSLATDREALLAGNKTQQKQQPKQLSYAEQVMKAVRPYIAVPPQLGGKKHTVELSVRIVDQEGKGGVEQMTVSKSSGRGDVDAAVLAALCEPGILPAPPEQYMNLRLVFTLQSN